MIKLIGVLGFIGTLLYFLIFNIPTARLGSGFLIGTSSHLFTYYDLVKESKFIKVIFPNEEGISATVLYKDPTHNLAVLKLNNPPKVKAKNFKYTKTDFSLKSEHVYTLGYPWTNTMEDQHVLIKGSTSLNSRRDLIPVTMPLNPVNSGSPIFNSNNELAGMVLFGKHAIDFYKLDKSKVYNYIIPASKLIKVLRKLKLTNEPEKIKNHTRELFVESLNKNIILIEAY